MADITCIIIVQQYPVMLNLFPRYTTDDERKENPTDKVRVLIETRGREAMLLHHLRRIRFSRGGNNNARTKRRYNSRKVL